MFAVCALLVGLVAAVFALAGYEDDHMEEVFLFSLVSVVCLVLFALEIKS